jgi:hypothetical protein
VEMGQHLTAQCNLDDNGCMQCSHMNDWFNHRKVNNT